MGNSVLGSARNGETWAWKYEKWGHLGRKMAKLENCWLRRAKMGNGMEFGEWEGQEPKCGWKMAKNGQFWGSKRPKMGNLGLKRVENGKKKRAIWGLGGPKMGNLGFGRDKNEEFGVQKGKNGEIGAQ